MKKMRVLVLASLLVLKLPVSGQAQWMQDPVGGLPSCTAGSCVVSTSTYASPGSTTWTQTYNGDVFVWATVVGAGGGGGGCEVIGETGGGGGGSGEVRYMFPIGHVPYNTSLTVYVGTGGAGGNNTNGNTGHEGEDSYLAYNGRDIVRAAGGGGGAHGVANYAKGSSARGGDGGLEAGIDGLVANGCINNASSGSSSGNLDGHIFGGQGGGCGTNNGESVGGTAMWWHNAADATQAPGAGGDGGSGGSTMFAAGGNGGLQDGANPTEGTIGAGGGGSRRCVSGASQHDGRAGGDGKIFIYMVR